MHFPPQNIKYQKPDSSKMCKDGRLEDEGSEGTRSSPSMRASYVKFKKGAHTKWHYHTGEQMLLGIQGRGFLQFKDGTEIKIDVGTRVYVPRRRLHRHGALKGQDLIHLAVTTGKTKWRKKDDPCDKHDE